MSCERGVRSRPAVSAAALALLLVAGACARDSPPSEPAADTDRRTTSTTGAEPGSTARVTDGRDDAYRNADVQFLPPASQPPDASRSDRLADIVDAEFRTVSRAAGSHTYRVTLRINATTDSRYNYWVGGKFGPDCDLFHYLGRGSEPVGRVFCERTSKFIGLVTSTPVDAAGDPEGAVLAAEFTYDPQTAPAPLAADPILRRLFAYTCAQAEGGFGCLPPETIDYVVDGGAVFRL